MQLLGRAPPSRADRTVKDLHRGVLSAAQAPLELDQVADIDPLRLRPVAAGVARDQPTQLLSGLAGGRAIVGIDGEQPLDHLGQLARDLAVLACERDQAFEADSRDPPDRC